MGIVTSIPVHFRPYRHLCGEAQQRDEMSDADFYAHVYPDNDDDDYLDQSPALGLLTEPCGECGAVGACAWDSEGRPLLHPINEEET